MSGPELERLLFHMPVCAQNARTAWAKSFAADMAKRAHWRKWTPTRRQIETMQNMVESLFSGSDIGELIE
jgi:hypothetical protein